MLFNSVVLLVVDHTPLEGAAHCPCEQCLSLSPTSNPTNMSRSCCGARKCSREYELWTGLVTLSRAGDTGRIGQKHSEGRIKLQPAAGATFVELPAQLLLGHSLFADAALGEFFKNLRKVDAG